jgi:hypothetical protein
MEPEGSLPHSQEPATCPYQYNIKKLKSQFKIFKIFKLAVLVSWSLNRGIVFAVNCKRVASRVVVWSGVG